MITVIVKRSMSATLPRIVFENDSYWLIDKPAGWLSVPGRPETHRDPAASPPVVTEWLKGAYGVRHLGGAQVSDTVGVVHRLDRFTSGIMIYAKTALAHEQANSWFMNREVKKTYQFLASPPPSRPAIQIKTPVHGKPAQTLFEVISHHTGPEGQAYFFGKATPLTGRFHQIREHARDAGFPILGDPSTHGLTFAGVERVCLHAFELALPFGTFQAPLAADLQALITGDGLS
jgi:23S rRNA pseudouridine1911/1915/1917 synthase